MTKRSIGEQAKSFRLAKRWNTTQMANAVGASRQNIETLESKPERTPRYMKSLAKCMGVTVDDMLNGVLPILPADPNDVEIAPADPTMAYRITAKRNELGLSVKECAEHLGLSVQSIYFYEKGERELSGENLFALADLFGVSARWIVLGIEDGSARPIILPAGMHPAVAQSVACLTAYIATGGNQINLVHAAVNLLEAAAALK